MKQRFLETFEEEHVQSELFALDNETARFSKIPPKVRIRTRYVEDEIFVDTSGHVWQHDRYFKIDWNKCELSDHVKTTFQQYIWYRLASSSPITAASNFAQMIAIQTALGNPAFPWSEAACKIILAQCSRDEFFNFRLFYRWASLNEKPGFLTEIASALDDLAGPEFEIYRSIKDRKNILSPSEEESLLDVIENIVTGVDYFSFQDNVISHISWELGCRPEQVAGIEHQHLKKSLGPNGEEYFHLSLIRIKQRSFNSTYRNRVISRKLAEKLLKLIDAKENHFGNSKNTDPIFITASQKRIIGSTVRFAIADICQQAGISSGTSTLLRHNMAQKLADQGTPGDLISDMLDHTTKVAARYYVAATPEIGKIKARALGKNATYKELMSLMTGAVIRREDIRDNRQIVKGMVATRYIGHIGACGLDPDTACNKNPIYSCYTCRKFHPFFDGQHAQVIEALRMETQILLNQSLDLHENKVVLQLEKTIEFAERTQSACQSVLMRSKNET